VQEGKNAKANAARARERERERVKISGGGLKVWLTFVVSILWCKGECTTPTSSRSQRTHTHKIKAADYFKKIKGSPQRYLFEMKLYRWAVKIF
jgi:hypothetical protein